MVRDDNVHVFFITDIRASVEYIRKPQGRELAGQGLAVLGD